MKPTLALLFSVGLAAATQSAWFRSSDSQPPYKSWSASQLTAWLEQRGIAIPDETSTNLETLVEQYWDIVSPWTHDQYVTAQKTFTAIQDTTFHQWDESRLRHFLLKQGIVAPKSTRDELVRLADAQYRAYMSAASSYASTVSPTSGPFKQAAQSLSSLANDVTEDAMRNIDETRDYVYSSWDDSQIRAYLESKGIVVKDKDRPILLAKMYDSYAKVTRPMWEAWSNSYIHEWLHSHNLLSPSPPEPYTREYLLRQMSRYYYDANERVYSTWSDSQLQDWLIQNGLMKSGAQLPHEKLYKLVEDNYLSSKSTALDAWSDSSLREWLVRYKYIDNRTAAGKKRDELVALMKDKYNGIITSYLAWPDARLRAYLRRHGISEDKLPTSRPGLLQEVRIRWVQTQTLWDKVRDVVNGVEENVEDRLGSLWTILKGKYDHGRDTVYESATQDSGRIHSDGDKAYESAKDRAYNMGHEAKEQLKQEL